MCSNLKDLKYEDQVRGELSHLAYSYYSKYKPNKNSLKKHKVLEKLKSNENIVIIKPDKGNGVVIVDKQDYVKVVHRY